MPAQHPMGVVLESARRLGSLRMVLLGVELANSLLEVPVPPLVARSIACDPVVQMLPALAFLYTALRFPRLVRKYWIRVP